jgi:hypothetical protein
MIFRIRPAWDASRNNPYPWADSVDDRFECNELWSTRALSTDWIAPIFSTDGRAPIPDVLCCPGGFFVFSELARRTLSSAVGSSAEWLPVGVQKLGRFHILHPLHALELGPRAQVSTNAVSANITLVHVYDVPADALGALSVFYVRNPVGSAARERGHCYPHLLATHAVAQRWRDAGLQGIVFEPVE